MPVPRLGDCSPRAAGAILPVVTRHPDRSCPAFGAWFILLALSCGSHPEHVSSADAAVARAAPSPAVPRNPSGAPRRNPKWAVPMTRPGLPNLHEVAPNVYRGAQPETEGFAALETMGVRTVINLRTLHSDVDEMGESKTEGSFQYFEIPMPAWDVTDQEAARFLSIVENEDNLPVFYHCQHGADRTGTMTAVYRIAHQGWTAEEAIDEMRNGGFGYHAIWTNLVSYLRAFDTRRVRKLMNAADQQRDRDP